MATKKTKTKKTPQETKLEILQNIDEIVRRYSGKSVSARDLGNEVKKALGGLTNQGRHNLGVDVKHLLRAKLEDEMRERVTRDVKHQIQADVQRKLDNSYPPFVRAAPAQWCSSLQKARWDLMTDEELAATLTRYATAEVIEPSDAGGAVVVRHPDGSDLGVVYERTWNQLMTRMQQLRESRRVSATEDRQAPRRGVYWHPAFGGPL